jgi:hypothetical protein
MKGRKRKSEQNALSREISIIILYYRRLARSKSLLGWLVVWWWVGRRYYFLSRLITCCKFEMVGLLDGWMDSSFVS